MDLQRSPPVPSSVMASTSSMYASCTTSSTTSFIACLDAYEVAVPGPDAPGLLMPDGMMRAEWPAECMQSLQMNGCLRLAEDHALQTNVAMSSWGFAEVYLLNRL